MSSAKASDVPLSPSLVLCKNDGDPVEDPYSELIGSLLYLSVCTRPDIAQSVGALARYSSAPKTPHWRAAKGVLRYLAGTPALGITFGAGQRGLQGYADADYAGDHDTRRSTTGYVFTLHGGAIAWSSRLQPTVAASTTEAEYMAASYATKEALWLKKLMADLHVPVQAVKIAGDNQGALKLVKHPIASVRSKHIDVMHHFVRERVARGEVRFDFLQTGAMIADCLTKAVARDKLLKCREGMGMLM